LRVWYYHHEEELSDFSSFVSSAKIELEIQKFSTFDSISVPTSILGFLLVFEKLENPSYVSTSK
jgi:hypothetical protein